MSMTRAEALQILDLEEDADKGTVRQSYKELALRWHPDKNPERERATKKFQEISCAYKKLISGEDDDDDLDDGDIMTTEDMYALFRQMYYAGGAGSAGAGIFGSLLEEIMHQQMYHNGYEDDEDMYDSGDMDGEDFENDVDFFDYESNNSDFFMPSGFDDASYVNSYRCFHPVTEEEAWQNAQELMKEEETEKAAAKKKEDKQKAKNKRKKEAKKRKKAAQNGKTPKASGSTKGSEHDDSEDETKAGGDENDFDMSSAFVRGRPGVAKAKSDRPEKDSSETRSSVASAAPSSVGQATPTQVPVSGDVEDATSQARSYAMRGNELAQLGHYQAAIDMFSEAIKLHDSDHRYYGNRSFCYDRLTQYNNAERDANRAIDLSPEWPKGYFRRARALAGQKHWKEAEDSFEVVLALDPSCTDAWVELKRIRAYQLQDMGFSHEQALLAIDKYQKVPQALDALLSGAIFQKDPEAEAVYESDDASDMPPSAVQFTTRDDLSTPNAGSGICSIWVGNVNHALVNQADIRALFQRYGEISSVRTMPAKHCIFVNYRSSQSASNAMRDLQGYFIGDMNLSIRYPDSYLPAQEPVENPRLAGLKSSQHSAAAGGAAAGGAAGGTPRGGTARGGHHAKGNSSSSSSRPARSAAVGAQARAARQREQRQQRQPPASNSNASGRGSGRGGSGGSSGSGSQPSSKSQAECMHWRSGSGCAYGKKCRFQHIPANKGIDIQ